MIHIDTNSLIRFFTKDEPAKAIRVKNLIESSEEIYITDAVFPEIEYVLKRLYKTEKPEIFELLRFLTSKTNITTSSQVKTAVGIFETSNLDMADCIIAAYSLGNKLASFDEKLLKIPGVKGYW